MNQALMYLLFLILIEIGLFAFFMFQIESYTKNSEHRITNFYNKTCGNDTAYMRGLGL